MINKPINFRPLCNEENEDIRKIHQFYKMLKMHRNSELLTEEMLYSLNILNPIIQERVIKGIKLTPWRALVIAKERKNAEQQ